MFLLQTACSLCIKVFESLCLPSKHTCSKSTIENTSKYVNPLSAKPTKWSNTQTICRQQPTNCLSVFDHLEGLALKGLTLKTFRHLFVFDFEDEWSACSLKIQYIFFKHTFNVTATIRAVPAKCTISKFLTYHTYIQTTYSTARSWKKTLFLFSSIFQLWTVFSNSRWASI